MLVAAMLLLDACARPAPRAAEPVDAVIARERWRIKECFTEALRVDAHAGGTYKLRFELGPTGAVKRILLVSSEGTPAIGDCLARSFVTVQFSPPSGGRAEFTVPFVLSSEGGALPPGGPIRCAVQEGLDVCKLATIDDAALSVLAQKKPEDVFLVFLPPAQNADLATIARWPKVRRLMIYETAIDDLASLSGLADLELLALTKTKVTNLAPLASLSGLRHLNLRGSPVADLSPLAKHTKLETVVLTGTAVTDLWPLMGSAKSLRRLVVPPGVPESSLSTFRAGNPALEIRRE